MCEKGRLLHQIRVHDFALTEVTLFLDSHPEDPMALAYYQKQKLLLDEAMRLYQEQFGPLTNRQVADGARWAWIENPWPWEMEG